MIRRIHSHVVLAILAFAPLSPCLAETRTWIGGNGVWEEGAINNTNWSGFDEPDYLDQAVFETPTKVTLNTSNEVDFLHIQGGTDLDLNGQDLVVHHGFSMTEMGSNVIVNGSSSRLTLGWLNVTKGAKMELRGGAIQMHDSVIFSLFGIDKQSEFRGQGIFSHHQSLPVKTDVIDNNGTISAIGFSALPTLPPAAGSLIITGTDRTHAEVDLDGGGSEEGVVNVHRNQTLSIDLPIADAFGGEMNLYHDATLDIDQPWTLNGQLVVRSNTIPATGLLPGIPASTSTIAGGPMTQTGGLMTIVGDSTLKFDAPFLMENGHIQSGGTLLFQANDANIEQDALITLYAGKIKTSLASFWMRGKMDVAAGAASSIDVEAGKTLAFLPTSSINIGGIVGGELRIQSDQAEIHAGAKFSGVGTLRLENASQLLLHSGTNVGVALENSGSIDVSGVGNIGSAQVKNLVQTEFGSLGIELNGNAPTKADQLRVQQLATLDGQLRLSLQGGFVPSISDPLITVLMASSGVSGVFDSVINPLGMPAGLHYEAIYNPTSVQLKVVPSSLLGAAVLSLLVLAGFVPGRRTGRCPS